MSLTFAVNWPPPNSFTSWRSEAEEVGARQSGRQRASGTARITSPRKLTRLLYLSYGAAPRARRCQLGQSTIFQKESFRLIFPSANSNRSHPRTSIGSPVRFVPRSVHSDT